MTLPTASRLRATTHVRDQQAAIRNLADVTAAKRHAAVRAWMETEPRPLEAIASDIGTGVGRMIAIQMGAYPDSWPDADKREMAELHLFGRK